MNEFEIGREIERLNQRVEKLENQLYTRKVMTKEAEMGGGGGVTAADMDIIVGATRPSGKRSRYFQ